MRFVLCLILIRVEGEHALFVQRKTIMPISRKESEGKYCFWGGAIEPSDASPEEAIIRELDEELPGYRESLGRKDPIFKQDLGDVRYYLLLDDRMNDWRSISRLVEEGVGHPILLKDLAQLEQSGVVQWIIPELSIVAHQLIADINSMLRAKSKDNTQFS